MADPIVYHYTDINDICGGANKFFKQIGEHIRGAKTAIKIHFGEDGNTTYIRPEWILGLKDHVPTASFVECNVLYNGSRTVKSDHLRVAEKHGFNFLPIDILDGEQGDDYTIVELNIGDTVTAKLGLGINHYEKFIALTHFKGHMATGFGGSMKNIGMGMGSRAGKLAMHALPSPIVKSGDCIACGKCAENCPAQAINVTEKAVIESESCVGCVRCVVVCPKGAVDIPWDLSDSVNKALMRRISEYCLAATKDRDWWHINFLTDITYDCDCLPFEQKPIMKNLGLVMGMDPVAVDAASMDLIVNANKGIDPFEKKHGVDGYYMLEYAESIGLGSKTYTLEEVKS